MKRIAWLSLLALLSFGDGWAAPLVVAHRGGAKLAPENTLAAFRNAVRLGATAVELDIHPTRDGQLVVLHDETLERTTNGKGRVSELSLAEIQSHDAGSWFDPKFAGEVVPTLDQVLDVTSSITTVIEIKHPARQRYAGIETALLDLLRRRQALSKVIVISFDEQTLRELHAAEPTLPLGYLFGGAPDLEKVRHDLGAAYLGPYHALVNADFMGRAHALGMKVNPWTVNDPQRMRELLELGVEAMTTDRPDLLLDACR